MNIMTEIGAVNLRWRATDRRSIPASPYLIESRPVAGGARTISANLKPFREGLQYLELNGNGVVFFAQVMDVERKGPRSGLQVYRVAVYVDTILEYAARYYTKLKWAGPITIHVELTALADIVLLFDRNDFDHCVNNTCPDETIVLTDVETRASGLGNQRQSIVQDCVCNLVWSFGYMRTVDQVHGWFVKQSVSC
jgi:hypothetical protein